MRKVAYLMTFVILLTGCAGHPAPEPAETGGAQDGEYVSENALTCLSFHYSGTIMGIIRSYVLRLQEGKLELTTEDVARGDENPRLEIDPAFMIKVEALCTVRDIRSWDGFDRSVSGLADGEGFALTAEYSDGTSISAKGYGAFPDGYFDFKHELLELLQPYIDELHRKN